MLVTAEDSLGGEGDEARGDRGVYVIGVRGLGWCCPGSFRRTEQDLQKPAGATVVVHNRQGIVFRWKTGDVGNESTTFYGCAQRIGRKVRLWRCDAGQLTSETLQTVHLKGRSAILEIERKPESRTTFFHLTRRVNLRTGKRRDTKSESRPQPPGTEAILGC